MGGRICSRLARENDVERHPAIQSLATAADCCKDQWPVGRRTICPHRSASQGCQSTDQQPGWTGSLARIPSKSIRQLVRCCGAHGVALLPYHLAQAAPLDEEVSEAAPETAAEAATEAAAEAVVDAATLVSVDPEWVLGMDVGVDVEGATGVDTAFFSVVGTETVGIDTDGATGVD